jgi:hypothetical protein
MSFFKIRNSSFNNYDSKKFEEKTQVYAIFRSVCSVLRKSQMVVLPLFVKNIEYAGSLGHGAEWHHLAESTSKERRPLRGVTV